MRQKSKLKSRKEKPWILVFLYILAATAVLPILLMIIASITDETTLVQNGYSYFPSKISFDSYAYLFSSSGSIIKSYVVTAMVTIIGTCLNLALTILLAYPLSFEDLPGRNKISFFVFFTMLFSGGLVPSYIMWTRYFQIKNHYAALIIPNLMLSAFYVIMMRTNFSTNIPREIIDAARIDGCGEFKILLQVVLPMSKPIIATVALMVGLAYWNDWTNGLYYLTDTSKYGIQNVLNRMVTDAQFLQNNAAMLEGHAAEMAANIPTNTMKMAVAVLGALPILIIYPFFQKYFVKGITVGAVKG